MNAWTRRWVPIVCMGVEGDLCVAGGGLLKRLGRASAS
jgi:hypothetical protein